MEILRQVKLVGENDGNRGPKTAQMIKRNGSPKTNQQLVDKNYGDLNTGQIGGEK